MTPEQLNVVNVALKAAFGQEAPIATIQEEYIAVDSWTIGVTEVEVNSILGTKNVPGFILEVGVPYSGGQWEPDGIDLAEVAQDRSFYTVVVVLVGEIAKMKANAALENLAIDAYVKEWEEDQRLAEEYYNQRRE